MAQTLLSSSNETTSIQPQFSRTIHDINFVFAPLCTSREFTFEVEFQYIHRHKKAKIFEIFNIFEKFDFKFQTIVVKYKGLVNNIFFQKAQKMFKKERESYYINGLKLWGGLYIYLIMQYFCAEKLLEIAFYSYLGLKVSARHKIYKNLNFSKFPLSNQCA